jgi:hypothetical protein
MVAPPYIHTIGRTRLFLLSSLLSVFSCTLNLSARQPLLFYQIYLFVHITSSLLLCISLHSVTTTVYAQGHHLNVRVLCCTHHKEALLSCRFYGSDRHKGFSPISFADQALSQDFHKPHILPPALDKGAHTLQERVCSFFGGLHHASYLDYLGSLAVWL